MPGAGEFNDFDPNNPYTAIALLGERVKNLGIEKESLERDLDEERRERTDLAKRVSKMENSFQRGAGILMVLPIVGTIVGVIFAYGKVIFRPWSGTP